MDDIRLAIRRAVSAAHRLDFSVAKDVAIGTSTSVGLLVFDGTAGQGVGLKIVPGTTSPPITPRRWRPMASRQARHSR